MKFNSYCHFIITKEIKKTTEKNENRNNQSIPEMTAMTVLENISLSLSHWQSQNLADCSKIKHGWYKDSHVYL